MGAIATQVAEKYAQARTMGIYIANIGDDDWYASRSYGDFHVPARHKFEEAEAPGQCRHCETPKNLHPENGSYGIVEVKGRKDRIDWGDNRTSENIVFADEIAKDLLREQGLADRGVFICETSVPTKTELKHAEERLTAYLLKVIEVADGDWMRFHNISMIPDMAKRAAKRLGMHKDYVYTIMPTQDCPGCGEHVKLGIAFCPNCHTVIDFQKAKQLREREQALESGGPLPMAAAVPIPDDSVFDPDKSVEVKKGRKK
jgi:hypothetical protein